MACRGSGVRVPVAPPFPPMRLTLLVERYRRAQPNTTIGPSADRFQPRNRPVPLGRAIATRPNAVRAPPPQGAVSRDCGSGIAQRIDVKIAPPREKSVAVAPADASSASSLVRPACGKPASPGGVGACSLACTARTLRRPGARPPSTCDRPPNSPPGTVRAQVAWRAGAWTMSYGNAGTTKWMFGQASHRPPGADETSTRYATPPWMMGGRRDAVRASARTSARRVCSNDSVAQFVASSENSVPRWKSAGGTRAKSVGASAEHANVCG